MSDPLFGIVDLAIAATFVFVVLAAVAWTRIGRRRDSNARDPGSRQQPTATFMAHAGHWGRAAVGLVIGVLLGGAISGLVQLIVAGAWGAVVELVLLAVVLSLIVWLHGRLGEKLLPSGIRPARGAKKTTKPWVRRVALPAGLVVGVGMAVLGPDGWLLGWLS